MLPRWVGWIAAIGLLVLLTVPWFISAANGGDDVTFGSDAGAWTFLVAMMVLALATGFLLPGWAIPILILSVVVLVPLGENRQDSDDWPYYGLALTSSMLFATPAVMLAILARLFLEGFTTVLDRRRSGQETD